jgi:arsenate reductase
VRILACFILASLLSMTKTIAQKQKIVFVCEHGVLRSAIAAKCFNELAREKNLNWEAVPRAVNTDEGASEKTKAWLIKENFYDSSFRPTRISKKDIKQSKGVYLFDALPADVKGKNKITGNWHDSQTFNGDYDQLKKTILFKVGLLIDSLKKVK